MRHKKSTRKSDNHQTNRSRFGSPDLASSEATGPFRIVRRGEETGNAFDMPDDQVEQALVSGADRDLLEDYFGESHYDEFRQLAEQASRRRPRGPRVLVVPGIMGSKLGYPRKLFFDDCLWIDPVDIIRGRLSELALRNGGAGIKALGVFLLAYLRIKLRLANDGFDADFHPFDWRQPIAVSGKELADRIRQESNNGRSEFYLVAHSMGGLVSRAALKALGADGALVRRLIMLGTPNFGSFSPVAALRATHDTVRKLAKLDLRHTPEELANQIFSSFTGLCELLPARTHFTAMDFFDLATWPEVPALDAKVLREAARLNEGLAAADERFTLIAGVNQETVVSCRRQGNEFIYTTSFEGDGTVPLSYAQLPGVSTYYIDEGHGSLPNNQRLISAVIDVINTGQTDRLPDSWTPVRRAVREVWEEDLRIDPFGNRAGGRVSQAEVRSLISSFAAPPALAAPALQPPTAVPAFSAEAITIGRRHQQRIEISLAHGDIASVNTRALVLGIFRGVAPSGPAGAIDARLGGAIRQMTERRMFSGNRGEVFIIPAGRHNLSADMVFLAGLGSYDEFTLDVLELVAENVARTMAITCVEDFATVVFGSGSGLEINQALEKMIAGFFQGMRDVDTHRRVHTITLCEFNGDRYRQLKQELLRLTLTPLFDQVEVTVDELTLPPPLPEPGLAQRAAGLGPDPAYLIVRAQRPDRYQASLLTAEGKATIITADLDVNEKALRQHLAKVEDTNFASFSAYGAELAELVLPEAIRHVLSTMSDRPIVVIHDLEASRIPWEALRIGTRDLALTGLSRKLEARDLSVAKWLNQRQLESRLKLLLIINPTEDLTGAAEEGQRMRELLKKYPAATYDELEGPAATRAAVRAAFQSGRYDIIHYAGHAYFDADHPASSGLLCSGHQVLNGADLSTSTSLPALVVFNACEAGRVRAITRGKLNVEKTDRSGLLAANAGIAESLLRGGIANYVGTYWPVGDRPASAFADAFYTRLMQGACLGDAMVAGRAAAHALQSIDWADYIHYGSWRFRIKVNQ